MTSADQDAWVVVAESLRAELAKTITQMGAMEPDELKQVVEAVGAAMELHCQALTMDKRVELELARVVFAD